MKKNNKTITTSNEASKLGNGLLDKFNALCNTNFSKNDATIFVSSVANIALVVKEIISKRHK